MKKESTGIAETVKNTLVGTVKGAGEIVNAVTDTVSGTLVNAIKGTGAVVAFTWTDHVPACAAGSAARVGVRDGGMVRILISGVPVGVAGAGLLVIAAVGGTAAAGGIAVATSAGIGGGTTGTRTGCRSRSRRCCAASYPTHQPRAKMSTDARMKPKLSVKT
jgi:hypothetical protein